MIIRRANLRFLSYGSARNLSCIFIVVILSCEPSNTLDNKKFQEILFKMHECEAYNEIKFENKNSVFLENCKAAVLKESNVSPDLFYNTVEKYKANATDFEKLYDTLINQSESKSIN